MPQPDLRCYHHPDREAAGQCDRCGDYLCEECALEHDELQVCPQCYSDLTRLELPENGKWACVLNLVAIVTAMPMAVGDAPEVICLALPIQIAGAFFAMRMEDSTDAAVNSLRKSIGLTAAVPLLAVFGLPVVVGNIVGGALLWFVSACLLLLSCGFWFLAARRGAKPAWAVIVSVIPPVLYLAAPVLGIVLGFVV